MGTERQLRNDFELGDEFARVLAETTQSLVCVLDDAGSVLLFNDACERATGFSREEVLGRQLADTLIPPEESEAFREVLSFIWSTGHASPQVGHWLTKDGGRVLVAWSNKPVPANASSPAYLVTSGINLTGHGAADGELADDPASKLVEVGRLAQEQRALRRVATLVASEASPERVFMAVSTECARALEVGASSVWRYEGDDTATVVGGYNRDDVDPFPLGTRLYVAQTTLIGRVRETGLPARVDDWGSTEGVFRELMLQVGYRSTAAAPIIVAGTLWGAVTISSAEQLPADAEPRLAAFCDLVSLAVASAQAREDLQTSRARIVRAGDEQRRRLERNLHDGAQQRLVAATLLLRVAQARLESDPEAVRDLLANAAGELDAGLEELRELARGLHPGALTEHGLRGALESFEERLPIPVEIQAPSQRLDRHVEATAYFIVSEALTNTVKHARASSAGVTVERAGNTLRLEISDDGRGGADTSKGTGLLGLRDRAEAEGGTLTVVSPPGRGTVVTATLPLTSDPD